MGSVKGRKKSEAKRISVGGVDAEKGFDLESAYNSIDEEIKAEEKSKKKPLIGLILALVLLIGFTACYVAGAVYFTDRFFFNTEVNGVDFSRQRAVDARYYVESKAADFYLTITSADGGMENIYAHEIDLTFIASDIIETLIEEQNIFLWPLSLFNERKIVASFDMTFDQNLLNERVKMLEFVVNGQTDPVAATVVMDAHEVVVVPQQYGNVVDIAILQDLLQQSVSQLERTFDADRDDIFIQPALTTESLIIIDTFDHANRYLSAEITYLVGREVVLDRETISDWVTITEDFEVHLDEGGVQNWLNDFIPTVNTHGTTRELTTPRGRNVSVTGGYYGWIISRDLEFAELLSNIRDGVMIEREPIYFQRAMSHGPQDWGNTFLQVDMRDQHMWAIVAGEVVFDAPVVTGLPRDGRNTPQGVYFILQMESPSVLIGADDPETGEPIYETEVEFWMRTTWAGHGFHDATWQTSFGGRRYRTHGSHGCTNLSLEDARTLYNLIFLMMPVVVHY